MSEENRAAFRHFLEEMDRGNLDIIDDMVAEDAVLNDPLPGQGPGRAGLRRLAEMLRASFPDLDRTIRDLVADGDGVAARTILHGTHRGEFMGVPATGRRVEVPTMVMVRFRDGRIVEHWSLVDVPLLMMQIGAVPAQGAGETPGPESPPLSGPGTARER